MDRYRKQELQAYSDFAKKMAQFAKKGEIVNIATYIIGTKSTTPTVVSTNGSEFVEAL